MMIFYDVYKIYNLWTEQHRFDEILQYCFIVCVCSVVFSYMEFLK